ncbi:MAG: nucleotide kinase domain-containing protein, partial [bacterium]
QQDEVIRRLCYWITERHSIHLKREAGLPKPWTKDPVMLDYFFTNPFRENDKVTRWFANYIRNPMATHHLGFSPMSRALSNDTMRLLEDLPWATVAFRWFNYIPTGIALLGGEPESENPQTPSGYNWDPATGFHHCDTAKDLAWDYDTQERLAEEYPERVNLFLQWDAQLALDRIKHRSKLGLQCFTGAYMIKIENARPKVDSCIDQINRLWNRRDQFQGKLALCDTLEAGWKIIKGIPFIGGFMAYEIVTDLRHTPYFEDATDIYDWCNLGPGAIRGIQRIMNPTADFGAAKLTAPPNWRDLIIEILDRCNGLLYDMPVKVPNPMFLQPMHQRLSLEMRDLEHSLCEFDKYERARLKQGQMKRRYLGRPLLRSGNMMPPRKPQ